MARGTSQRVVGLTPETANGILLDAGALYQNFGQSNQAQIGATRGGAVFRIAQTFRDVEVDGTYGPIKGLRRVIEANAMITATLIELRDPVGGTAVMDQFKRLLPGSADLTDTPTHYKLGRTGSVSDADYIANIAVVAPVSNNDQNFVGILKNVLQTGEIEVTLTDDNEGVVAVEFTAHYDLPTPTEEPWEIWFPKD